MTRARKAGGLAGRGLAGPCLTRSDLARPNFARPGLAGRVRGAQHQARHLPRERAAPAGQARIGHEIAVRGERPGTGRDPPVVPVGAQGPALRLVLEVGDHDLLEDLPVHRRVLDRHQRLDAPVHVARQPVGRGDKDLGLGRGQAPPGAEAQDAAVLEVTPDDALDPDVVGKTGHPRAQATDAAHHQVDGDAGARGAV